MKPLYTPGDTDPEAPGEPGQYPFTRGVHSGMYRDRLWTMRQYAGYGDAAQSNERYRQLISQGATGLSVAFDLPTQMGYDSDHSLAMGEVGRAGAAISSIADMERLFQGISLEKVSTSMTINSTSMILLALYVAVAKRQGAPVDQLRGTVQNDILKEYIARGTYIYPPRPSMRIVTDLFSWARRNAPKWNVISISGYHMREAGATAAQELGFTLANARAYIDAAVEAGLEIDELGPQLSFFFSADRNFLEEIAKFRAARRLYARLMRDTYGAKNPRSWKMRFHVQTAGSSLTAQQPEVNTVRTAIEALSAVLGGAQSLHTNSFDEALALPTESSAKLALRTQQVIAHETGVTDAVDPLGGAYAIEGLTDQVGQEAQAYLDRIAALGGMLSAIEQGYVQREIQNSAYAFQQQVESGEQVIVGVNQYQLADEKATPILKIDAAAERQRVAELAEFKASRDQAAVQAALADLAETASGESNLFPRVLHAVESSATLSEISDCLRAAFGTYDERVTV